MVLPRIFRTVRFQLMALYAGVFCGSAFIAGILLPVSLEKSLEGQLRNHILMETEQLMIDYRQDGLRELLHDIREARETADGDTTRLLYGVKDAKGRATFDFTHHFPEQDGWTRIVSPGHGHDLKLLVYTVPLAGGYRLAVAADLSPVHQAVSALMRLLAAAMGAALILSVAAGFFVSRRFIRKIDLITQAAEKIDKGALSIRIPLAGTGDDLDHLIGTLNDMLGRIQKLVGDLQQTASHISHDLRTPLGHLQRYIAQASSLPSHRQDEREAVLRAASEKIDQILEIFDALLRISELDTRSLRRRFSPIDMTALVASMAETYGPVAEERGSTLYHAAEEHIFMPGEPNLLRQALANLIENALTHALPGGPIHIRLRRDRKFIVLEVADNGPGIPEGERENVLRPLYRLDQSRSTPGTGLGLSLASSIAQLHDGEIRLMPENQEMDTGLRAQIRFAAEASAKE